MLLGETAMSTQEVSGNLLELGPPPPVTSSEVERPELRKSLRGRSRGALRLRSRLCAQGERNRTELKKEFSSTVLQRFSSLFALLAASVLLPCASARANPDDRAPVVRAVVYPDRALVTRSLEVPCGKTPSGATFAGLPWGLDETTLKATASGAGGRIEGLSLRQRVLQDAHLAQVHALDQRLEALRARIREVELQRAQAASSRAQGESLRATVPEFVAREAAAEPKPQTKAWAAALESSRRIIEAADDGLRKADASLRELNRDLQELLSQRGTLASDGPARAMEAEVLVRCSRAGAARVELSYMAGGVSWQPVYEARAARAREKVELAMLAQLVQATGEPWDGVQLTLSTATTRRDATPPEPKRLYVGATPEDKKKKVLVKRYEEVAHLSSLTTASAGSEGQAQTEEAGLSVRFEVPGKVDLPGDGRPMRLLVSRHSLPATFGLLTVPKMAPFAFRSAEVINRTAHPLLPGRVELFAGGSYLGHSQLGHVPNGDRLELAFGIEEPVKVRRVILTEQAKDPGFLGSTRRLNYGYRFELASHAAGPVELKVQEHVPVSQLDDVKVVLGEKTSSGYELAPADGIVTWKVKLAPGEKRELELHFAVEIPEEYDSSAL